MNSAVCGRSPPKRIMLWFFYSMKNRYIIISFHIKDNFSEIWEFEFSFNILIGSGKINKSNWLNTLSLFSPRSKMNDTKNYCKIAFIKITSSLRIAIINWPICEYICRNMESNVYTHCLLSFSCVYHCKWGNESLNALNASKIFPALGKSFLIKMVSRESAMYLGNLICLYSKQKFCFILRHSISISVLFPEGSDGRFFHKNLISWDISDHK